MFHDGNRALQDHFGSTALADRLVERTHRTAFTDHDRDFLEGLDHFFLATASPDGAPDCSFKGGPPGFVRVLGPKLLVWPDYDGNGMFKSLGNIVANPRIGLLFLQMGERPQRLRANGLAAVSLDDPLIGSFPGAQAVIRFTPEHIFPNCPRYIPDPEGGRPSPFLPRAGEAPLEPGWKSAPAFRDVVPPRKA